MRPQSFANHRAIPGPFFLAAFFVYVVLAVTAVHHAWASTTYDAVLLALAALALPITHLAARRNAQIVQDRIIRLEMQLRLARLMPGRDCAAIPLPHLIALRFASDGELPALVERVLAGELATTTAIKQAITTWQADWLRV